MVPAGWALCDGTNGTPDLTDKFIVGAGGSYSIGDEGGADTIDIRHNHDDGSLAAANDTHGHDVAGNTGSDAHGHDVTGNTGNSLSAAQDILPPYYALAWIMRVM